MGTFNIPHYLDTVLLTPDSFERVAVRITIGKKTSLQLQIYGAIQKHTGKFQALFN